MKPERLWRKRPSAAKWNGRAFTLIELLVVIAIITLLISILLPSLSKAREHARSVKSRSALKSIGDGLELYRNDNESDKSSKETNGYPPSAMGDASGDYDDPAITGNQKMAGAHWLVRHLLGADLSGYAPRRNVPANLLNPGADDEEVPWYGYDAAGKPVVDRVGPYVDGQAVKTSRTADLPQAASNPALIATQEEQVFVDTFGFPVLYYLANPTLAAKARAMIASPNYATAAIYTMRDNALFTGQCIGTMCTTPPWDFGDGDKHPLGDFAYTPPAVPTADTIRNYPRSFPYIILDKDLYDSSYDATTPSKTALVPYRKDSYILYAAGKDGIFGTQDDVTNMK